MVKNPVPNYNVEAPGESKLLDGIARFTMLISGAATFICAIFLFYTFFVFNGNTTAPASDALANIETFKKLLIAGAAVLAISTTYLFWGEDSLGVLQLIGAALLFAAPYYLPAMAGTSSGNANVTSAALQTLQMGGLIAGAISIVGIAIDLVGKIQLRVRQGSKADQLKYGKGIKEERDIQNVFMGKCWQLPFCRKFVREKCPIYHSKRTCWKERVGCMCEEEVIRNAMEGKVIPRDMVAAAKYIPRNSKLNPEQKAERCRQCVIYNEHQKHKYKLALPVIIVGIGGTYFFGREPLKNALGGVLERADTTVQKLTYSTEQPVLDANGQKLGPDGKPLAGADFDSLGVFKEVMLVCLMFVLLAYLMKLVEYLFFRLKV